MSRIDVVKRDVRDNHDIICMKHHLKNAYYARDHTYMKRTYVSMST